MAGAVSVNEASIAIPCASPRLPFLQIGSTFESSFGQAEKRINAEFCAELLANLGKVPTQMELLASRPARRFPWVAHCFGQAALFKTAAASELLGEKPSKKMVEEWLRNPCHAEENGMVHKLLDEWSKAKDSEVA
eukprot:s4253_g9.t1